MKFLKLSYFQLIIILPLCNFFNLFLSLLEELLNLVNSYMGGLELLWKLGVDIDQ